MAQLVLRALATLAAFSMGFANAVAAGCAAVPRNSADAPPPDAAAIRFRDVAAERGLPAVPNAPGDDLTPTILTASPGGCGFLDYDGDGDQDLLLLDLEGCALYANDGQGRFREVTASAGLGASGAYMGCATGDYNNDGWIDLFLCGYRIARLYRNIGGRFLDVSARSRFAADRWFSSAGFADVDGDGDLDLYAGAYVRYDGSTLQHCPIGIDAGGRVVQGACGPERYAAEIGRLYLNQGQDRFVDATAGSGLDRASGKTLGVAFADYDADGDVDLYLANDRVACDLFENLGSSAGRPRFRNVGIASGTAYNRHGNVQSGMGVDWGDFDDDGRLDLFVGTYRAEPKSVYRNLGRGIFQEASLSAGLTSALPYVTFGTCLFDADNDGRLDLFLANGHILGPVERVDSTLTQAQPMQLFRNLGATFADISETAGFQAAGPIVGRGAAAGDIDGDGRCDLLVVDLRGRARLMRNESTTKNHWLRLRLVGERSNRLGLGARVRITAGGRQQVRELTTSGSYLAAREACLHVGLGPCGGPVEVTVRWPSGGTSRVQIPIVDREVRIRENGRGGPVARPGALSGGRSRP